MTKEFNITGTCISEKHYMADTRTKLDAIELLVQQGKYFVINRPRQYGKTTTMYLLKQRLQARYVVIKISFEGVGDEVFLDVRSFGETLFKRIRKALQFSDNNSLIEKLHTKHYKTMNDIGDTITDFVMCVQKKVVLMIDEVDKSSNNQLFLSFLGMLRDKYLQRNEGEDVTFHSVILAGVHDIKNLKLKLRPDAEKKFNSPWNIAVDFDIDMRLHPDEIVPMLDEYSREHAMTMNTKSISERLYYYTNGYPFLVSKLCKIIDEKMLEKTKRAWVMDDIEEAVTIILKEKNTLFDDLIKNLEHNEALYRLVYGILLEGEEVTFNIDNPVIDQGAMYGIVRSGEGKIMIDNRIFEERIYNYMSSKIETSTRMKGYNFRDNVLTDAGALDMERVLTKFQLFMKEQYSTRDTQFLERHGRLLFLAFIKPIINGSGYDFKEPQISEEKRLDIVITFKNEKYVVELKIWRGEAAHQKGLKQLADYLQRMNLQQGYLLVYDFNTTKTYKKEWVVVDGKKICAAWV